MKKKLAYIMMLVFLTTGMIVLTGCDKLGDSIKTYEKENDEITNQLKNESTKSVSENKNYETNSMISKENKNINNSTLNNNSKETELSETEALKLGKELYEKALKLNGDDDTIYESDDVSEKVEKFKSMFTENGLKQYIDACFIYEENGVYYQGGGGSDITYISHEIKVDKIQKDRIEYKIIGTYNEEHGGGTTEEFNYSIVKSGDRWIIDEFATPW